jgi:hypothetical protein
LTQALLRRFRRIPGRTALLIGSATLMALFVACSNGATTSSEKTPTAVANDQALADEIFLFVISSDAAVGDNRLPFALRQADGDKVDVAPSAVSIIYTKRDTTSVKSAPEASFRQWPVGGGIFTTTAAYDSAGIWDFTATITNPDGSTTNAEAVTLVKDVSSTPAIGSAAPIIATKTGTTPDELALISSDANPIPELYAVSFDDALSQGRPVVITISTPAWCTSQTCGPQVTTVDEIRQKHGANAEFIHVEIFDNPAEMRETGDPLLGVESEAVKVWNIPSEPWTFVIDGNGLVAAKFEAYTTADEIEEALVKVLADN